ncbi:Chromosome-partitioning protein Spo0J [Pseudovibrio sp. Ad46]|uniref:ParB/RepB/Spo0J family partition protein n=1 Tax=unclassified Pseudovibrio TaxID=2627060 RepID=UPI0007AE4A22|nr:MULTISPECIES: ParB/RepB/Spo0J family partition protein [unclassified Pseudovibrio]KZK84200.1 Chromosome-partitioning protein Spo0J [Pseudovibrio sp. Ad46]KZK98937.1 Chromosome-partitioning protein Spo0J [Pseudovibrio sp. Ad5]
MTKTTNGKLLSNVPVSKLTLSALNPRQSVDPSEIELLAQSIKACGLIQNLVGFAEGNSIGIVAGGRRLRALQVLQESKDILPNYSVAVRIAATQQQALQWANAENTARKDLNPAEEIKAYRTMAQAGHTPDSIAIAFAQTVRHVKGRLRLSGLAQCILDALEAGKITLDIAAAYTVSSDQEKQADVFGRLNERWGGDQPHTIKRSLMDEVGEGNDRRAVFVGREAYEAAGGAIREDLFGEEVYYLDSNLLEQLATDKLEEARQKLLAQGWKWATANIELPDHTELRGLKRLYAEDVRLSEEQEERREVLIDAENEGRATPEELEELKGLSELQFHADQKSVAGVFVGIGYHGDLRAEKGYVAAEDQDAAIAAGVLKGSQIIAGTSQEPESKEYSQALMDDLNAIRTGALQAALLNEAELAKDIAIFSMITKSYEGDLPCKIQSGTWRNEAEDHGQNLPEELTLANETSIYGEDVAVQFAAFRLKSEQEKSTLLTQAVARSFAARIALVSGHVPFVELVADTVNLDARKTWTPNNKFLKRLKSGQLDEVKSYIDGKPVGPEFANMKKGDKVSCLHGLFNNEADRNGLSSEAKERIANWVPECLKTQYQAPDILEEEIQKLAA